MDRIIRSVAIVVLCLVLLLVCCSVKFGGIDRALRYLGGERILVNPGRIVSAAAGPCNKQVELVNLSFERLTVITANTHCTCTTISDLPVSLGPGEQCLVDVQYNLDSLDPGGSTTLELITTSTAAPSVLLEFVRLE